MTGRVELLVNVRPQLLINGCETRNLPERQMHPCELPAVCIEDEVRRLLDDRDRQIRALAHEIQLLRRPWWRKLLRRGC